MHSTALLTLLLLNISDFLREPDYTVAREGDRWVVQKPAVNARQPLTISQHEDRSAAESRKRSLPRLRLNVPFVRFDPTTYERTLVADWSGQKDAVEVEADVREILSRFAPAQVQVLLESTSLYMARLYGATGHTAEESSDGTRFVIYLDPFRATGRLHVAATLIHELTHLERYRARGFHANRAAAVLPKSDFVLLGLADEFAAYQAEANLVRSFLANETKEEESRAARHAMRDPELNWPVALTLLLGIEGPSDQTRRMIEARRQVILDVAHAASSYWDSHNGDVLDPMLRQTVRNWYKNLREWKDIEAGRAAWNRAESRSR
jgi:hypothetical protein